MDRKTMLGLLTVLAIGLLLPAYADSPLSQFNSGIPLDMIECNDDKLLVQSPSGKPACLTADTADKLMDRGYSLVIYMDEKIEFEENVKFEGKMKTDETLLESKQTDGISAPSTHENGVSTSEISKIPKLGEEFELKVTVQRDPPSEFVQDIRISISPEFEFVEESLPEDIEFWYYDDRTTLYYVSYQEGVIDSLTVKIKAVSEGHGFVFGSTLYDDHIGDSPYIYVDKFDSFHYEEKDVPKVRFIPNIPVSITWDESVAATQYGEGVSGASAPLSSEERIDLMMESINFADYPNDKRYFAEMPKAITLNVTANIPTFNVGEVKDVSITLQSLDRQGDYEHVVVELITSSGIKLDTVSILDEWGTETSTVYNNDIFSIDVENSLTINYPIKALESGTWMINFKINDEYYRHSVVVN